MKASIPLAACFSAMLLSPIHVLAQSTQAVSRLEIQSELEQLQVAGYSPSENLHAYPGNFQAAEARISQTKQSLNSAYGSQRSDLSKSGKGKN